MTVYQVAQDATGVVMWEGEATDAAEALLEACKAAGYDTIAEARSVASDDTVTIYGDDGSRVAASSIEAGE